MPAVIVDTSRAHAAGWTPEISFEDGVAEVWREWAALPLERVRGT
jgi:nucleoside-diphosphate-sugar epimerase